MPEEAVAAALLIHGRGGSAEGILDLADQVAIPGTSLWAPEASGRSWYPHGFMEPLERVRSSGRLLEGMGACVEARIYREMGHTVSADEILRVREMIEAA